MSAKDENGEFIMRGADLPEQIKQIFTDITGRETVGVMSAKDTRELFTYHLVGGQLIELAWSIKSVRNVRHAKLLEEIWASPTT